MILLKIIIVKIFKKKKIFKKTLIVPYFSSTSFTTQEQNSSTPSLLKGSPSSRSRDCCLIPWILGRWSHSWRRIPDWIKPWLESMLPRNPTTKSWKLLLSKSSDCSSILWIEYNSFTWFFGIVMILHLIFISELHVHAIVCTYVLENFYLLNIMYMCILCILWWYWIVAGRLTLRISGWMRHWDSTWKHSVYLGKPLSSLTW